MPLTRAPSKARITSIAGSFGYSKDEPVHVRHEGLVRHRAGTRSLESSVHAGQASQHERAEPTAALLRSVVRQVRIDGIGRRRTTGLRRLRYAQYRLLAEDTMLLPADPRTTSPMVGPEATDDDIIVAGRYATADEFHKAACRSDTTRWSASAATRSRGVSASESRFARVGRS